MHAAARVGQTTLITSSTRLARALAQDYHADQRRHGRSVWSTPAILPWPAFLRRCWRERLLSGRAGQTLLAPDQELAVWEQVIAESAEGLGLLRVPETAARAMEAWALTQAWELPVDSRFEASDDSAAFLGWAREFQRRCERNRWLEEARLASVLTDLFERGELPPPGATQLAGFDELNPQQRRFVAALPGSGLAPAPAFESTPDCVRLRDTASELRGAAQWSRAILERDPEARIGVVVPNLESLRNAADRIFREALHPGAVFEDFNRAYHLSIGRPLATYPLVAVAFLLLDLAAGEINITDAGMLLRSPFPAGAIAEMARRSQVDAKLRNRSVWTVSSTELRAEASRCPEFSKALSRLERESRGAPELQTASAWSRTFSRLLEATGWPGERPLTSAEYQLVEAWNKALSSFATLDAVTPRMKLAEALARLRRLAERTPWQPGDEDAPVQILGMLEASGLEFDHVWVMGLHEDALPAPANPNPFIPVAMQRDRRLPHSSPGRELEFAGKVLARLAASAPDVVFSCPQREQDRELAPTPLWPGAWRQRDDESIVSRWTAEIVASGRGALETLRDARGPAANTELSQRGGTSLLRDIAACPFRAFARYRLGARPLEESSPGLTPREKGSALHVTLALIWAELHDRNRLIELTSEELREIIARNTRAALDKLGPGIGRSLEQIRLESLLFDWLEIEKTRAPFTVVATESDGVAEIGKLRLRTRADRVDQLEDGRRILLDYKTGEVKIGGWSGDRPDEPQLPLYCAGSDEPLAGAALVQIQAGTLGFRGILENPSLLPHFKPMKLDTGLSLTEQVEEWRRVLARLADRFVAGQAEVDPKPNACDFCGLDALCRVKESPDD
jgi:ATP-dependent helicase/nuclease subunit B